MWVNRNFHCCCPLIFIITQIGMFHLKFGCCCNLMCMQFEKNDILYNIQKIIEDTEGSCLASAVCHVLTA